MSSLIISCNNCKIYSPKTQFTHTTQQCQLCSFCFLNKNNIKSKPHKTYDCFHLKTYNNNSINNLNKYFNETFIIQKHCSYCDKFKPHAAKSHNSNECTLCDYCFKEAQNPNAPIHKTINCKISCKVNEKIQTTSDNSITYHIAPYYYNPLNKKDDLIKVFHNTLNHFKNTPVPKVLSSSTKKLCEANLPYIKVQQKISVVNEDSFSAARKYCENFPQAKICVLDMASWQHAGGGVTRSAKCQEEDLCRQSNLYLALKRIKFPMSKDDIFLAKDVTVAFDDEYKLLEKPFNTDVIISAALMHPKLRKDNLDLYEFKEDYQLMKDKIKSIIKFAIYDKADIIVLGAFGAGAYGNPVNTIANIFHELLTKEITDAFSHVVFAVLSNGSNPNYDVFFKKFL
jgi:uncharacterized protein (TIGR02452 family)